MKLLAIAIGLLLSAGALAQSTLTTAQLTALKTEINADATLAALPNSGEGPQQVANALNAAPAVALSVWRTDCSVQGIFDAIDWSAYTPSSAVTDAALTTALIAEQRTTQLMAIQTKQLNLQNMTIGRTTLDASKANVRAGLRDSVIQVPSGAAGANTNPGGTSGNTVLTVCTRNATRGEKVLAQNAGALVTTGGVSAALLGFEGLISVADVVTARNLP